MPDCSFCVSDNNPGIASRGDCSECDTSVCGQPSRRGDGLYHGEHCWCSDLSLPGFKCKRLTCWWDIDKHSARHGSTPTTCFPGLAGQIASAAQRAALTAQRALLQGVPVGQRPRTILSHFLSTVSPGQGDLERALASQIDPTLVEASLVHGSKSLPVLSPDFFTGQRLTRCFLLAAREQRSAALRLAQLGVDMPELPDWLGQFELVEGWRAPRARWLDIAERVMERLTPPIRSRQGILEAPRLLVLPEDRAGLAHWLIYGDDAAAHGAREVGFVGA